MATNTLPRKIERLFALAQAMISGDTALGATLHVAQNTAPVMQAAYTAALDAEALFQTTRGGKNAGFALFHEADTAAYNFITLGKRILAVPFGAHWNASWAQAGFTDASLAIPQEPSGRQTVLGAMRTLLTAHGEYENEPMGFTATHASEVLANLVLRRAGANAALDAVAAARAGRDATEEALRIRMRGLITELATLLKPDDSRWHSFGLNAPADPSTPETPEAPLATPGASGSGALMLDWHVARRAERYRIWLKKPGEPDFLPVLTVHDHEATLTGLPLAVPLALRLTAANDAGESVPGPEAVVTLG